MVNKMLLHPQEIETFYILPTLRRYFALYLKELGLKQKEVAELLGINSATISQYSSNKRGHQIDFQQDVLDEIKLSAHKIKNTATYFRETQHILAFLRSKKVICDVHKQFSPVPENCEPDDIGCNIQEINPCKINCSGGCH